MEINYLFFEKLKKIDKPLVRLRIKIGVPEPTPMYLQTNIWKMEKHSLVTRTLKNLHFKVGQ